MQNKIKKICGLYIGLNVFGNCFWPAVVLDWRRGKVGKHAKAILTIRTGPSMETKFYWNGAFKFWWNSAHLARRFGTFQDTDFGGFYRWRGHLDM